MNHKSNIQKAGAIIRSYEKPLKVVLLYRKKENDWTFPKGHIEEGELSEKTMIREIREETGLSVKINKTLPNLKYTNSDGNQVEMTMFLVQADPDSKTQTEFFGDRVEWFLIEEVANHLSYKNLAEYFSEIESKLV
ncbi:MAG: NUDIX domain-containing protein [Candidatus Uhrbacteria bacterium]